MILLFVMLAAITYTGSSAHASTLVEQYIEAVDVDGTQCVPVERFAFIVVTKLPQNQYELRGDPKAGVRRAVLKLKGGTLSGKGLLGGIKVRYIDTKHMPTKDGFSYDYVFMENCR